MEDLTKMTDGELKVLAYDEAQKVEPLQVQLRTIQAKLQAIHKELQSRKK